METGFSFNDSKLKVLSFFLFVDSPSVANNWKGNDGIEWQVSVLRPPFDSGHFNCKRQVVVKHKFHCAKMG